MIVEAQTSQFSSSAHGGFDRGVKYRPHRRSRWMRKRKKGERGNDKDE